jgi:hypothetical protein
MIEIKKMTIQDLNLVKAYLNNAKASITWYGKKIAEINNESFSLQELAEKVLEISSSKGFNELTDLERWSGLETLQKIKELSHQAKEKLKAKGCFALFIRAILWIQEHILGVVSPQWRKKYIEITSKEAENNFLSVVLESGETIKANSAQVRKKAYQNLLIESAEMQGKSIEVIHHINNWCNGIDDYEMDEVPGFALFCEIVEFDNEDSVAIEAFAFIMSQIPYCIEEMCSKTVIVKVATIFWESCEAKQIFQKKLQKDLETEDSSVNKLFIQAKECALQQDFHGTKQALEDILGVLHQIQINHWSFAADHIPDEYVPKEKTIEHIVKNVCLLPNKSAASLYTVGITLEDERKAICEIGPFEFRAFLNIFPDDFTIDEPKSLESDNLPLVRERSDILKDFSRQLLEAKHTEDRSTRKTCDIITFLSFTFENQVANEIISSTPN